MKRELERAQRERDKANLDRDQAALERDQVKLDREQAVLERDKGILDRDLLMAERVQEQRLQESVANCDQIKSELERLQRRQQVVASGKEEKKTTTEPVVTRSGTESRMEVDEAPRSSDRFNLDRVAQEHMNEGWEAWMPSEPIPPVSNLEANRARPLMDIALHGLTSSSTSGSQSRTGTSRLRELQERLQANTLENAAREQRPTTWREHLVRSVVISIFKKNVDGRYHRHNREDWTAAQRERRDDFHDATWAEYFVLPRIPEGTIHLIIGDSLVRDLTRIQAHWQVGILMFSGAVMPQMLASR